ncbi:hypothetical protein OF83DRAFT_18780 [Amylostereum chailletii]|nr:hypothetical protein OF83DRAFT_18780 [Amylostereum chailletii]
MNPPLCITQFTHTLSKQTMAFNYYRNAAPGWGTQTYQFGTPPPPSFRPLDSWTGLDYYTAHSGGVQDPTPYHHAISRIGAGIGDSGIGLREAEMFHRRTYGGLDDIIRLLPVEIGHAAAYEAYRQLTLNLANSLTFSASTEHRREALVGLAVAEAVRLWQDSGRAMDRYGLQVASETAAVTASVLARATFEAGAVGGPGLLRRRNSLPGAMSSSYPVDDPVTRGRAMGALGVGAYPSAMSQASTSITGGAPFAPTGVGPGPPAAAGLQPGAMGPYASGARDAGAGAMVPYAASGGAPMTAPSGGFSGTSQFGYGAGDYGRGGGYGASYGPSAGVPVVSQAPGPTIIIRSGHGYDDGYGYSHHHHHHGHHGRHGRDNDGYYGGRSILPQLRHRRHHSLPRYEYA